MFLVSLSVLHSLKYFTTASSHIPNLPSYLEVGYVDGVEIARYDSKSRKAKAKQDWMNKITDEDPHYWERETQIGIGNEQVSKVNIEIAKERFNQTGGVHMVQTMYGCEWDDETDEVDGWRHDSYDGEDFISFDLSTLRWIAVKPQAVVSKHKLDQDDVLNQYLKHYYSEICPSYLKKYVSYGRDFLMRTELPVVSLLQKTPSSPITCHASGFYPADSVLFWRKDGEELHEDVEMGELLPNHDGTFQTTAHLKAELPADAEGRYECVFQLAGVEDEMVTKLDRRSILSNQGDARTHTHVITCHLHVFLLTSGQEEDTTKVTLAVVVPLALLALLAPLLVLLVKRHKSPPGEGRKCWPACQQRSGSQVATFHCYAPASADASEPDPEPASKSGPERDAEPDPEPASKSGPERDAESASKSVAEAHSETSSLWGENGSDCSGTYLDSDSGFM
ncbi:class I histocompatibility antigen, F10 alpha chain-like isoform X2 [Vanacampus margaritifer]